MIENVAGAGLDAGRAGLRRDHHLGVDSATGLLIRSPDFLGNLVPSCGYYGLAVTLIPSRAGTEWRRVRFAGEAGFPRYPRLPHSTPSVALPHGARDFSIRSGWISDSDRAAR